MTIEVKHKFVSAKADSADASLVRPSNWNDTHDIEMASDRLLGRTTAGAGPVQELTLGDGLEFSGTTLQVDTTFVAEKSTTDAALADKVNKAGDTMTGPLILPASVVGAAPLIIPDGVDPVAPTDGQLWRRDAGGGLRYRKGGSTKRIVDEDLKSRTVKAIIGDQQAQGTAQQSMTGGVWGTKNLNTEFYDPDAIVAVSSNQFTLVAGDYFATAMLNIGVSGSSLPQIRGRIWNVTDGVFVPNVVNPFMANSNTNQINAMLSLSAILTGGKTYRVELKPSLTQNVGSSMNEAGMPEIFMAIYLDRLTNDY